MTTDDVARFLELTRHGVRWLVSVGRLDPTDQTVSGQYLFRLGTVRALALERATRRLAPAERRHNPAGQIALPLQAPMPTTRPTPLSWEWATFRKARMLRAALREAKAAGETRTTHSRSEPARIPKGKPRVA